MAEALGQFLTSPVKSVKELQHLPSAVAALIASSPEYFARYSTLPLQEQIREHLGINIQDPRFGAWWERSSHLKNADRYTKRWVEFLRGRPNVEQVFQFARELAHEYGFQVNF